MGNTINLRSSGTDDNVCEVIQSSICDNCGGCSEQNNHFSINDFGDYFTVSYYHKIGDLVIERYSERIDKTTLKQI